MDLTAQDAMTASPLTIKPDASMGEAEDRMQEARIQCLIVAEDQDDKKPDRVGWSELSRFSRLIYASF